MRFRYQPQLLMGADVREVREDRKLPPDVRRKPWQEHPLPGSGGPTAGGAAAGQYPEYPPWLFPPATAYHIDLPLTRTPTAVAAGGSLEIEWPALPQGTFGVVRNIGVSTSVVADTRVTTRQNQAPVQPYPGVIGAIGELEEPKEIVLLLKSGDLFSVLVENIGAAGITVAVRTIGWWWYQ